MTANPLADDLEHILEHTRELWNDLRGERLFITGGTGFFGSWLLESFIWINQRLKLDAAATVLTRHPEAFIAKTPHLALAENITLLQGDTRDFAFPGGTFSHIIHAATQPTETQPAPLEQLQANITATQHTLDFSRQCGAKKFLFTSSGAVYGKQPTEITHLPETYMGAPDTTDLHTAYGQSKRISEYLCSIYAEKYRICATIARCFAFLGPYLPLNSNYAAGNFIRDALSGTTLQIMGDGTPYRSYLYTADLTIWLWTILFRGQPSRPYNVGSENDLTIAQLATSIIQELAPQTKIQIAKQPNPAQPALRYVPSTQRAKNELGLESRVSLAEAIRRTANFYKKRE